MTDGVRISQPKPSLRARSTDGSRYLHSTCQHDHWRRGHKQICKRIHRGGNAEQYNADKKYKEAVAAAVEACADDTKGQTCFICTEAVHRRTGEGLVRGCACHTTEGFVHVSCLAEQAKILVTEADEKCSDEAEWHRWYRCCLCKQKYHGAVRHALGWACWKTYVSEDEDHWARRASMTQLGNALDDAGLYEEWLNVLEVDLANETRFGACEVSLLLPKANMAICYSKLGRDEEALALRREVYRRSLALRPSSNDVFVDALNLSFSLRSMERYAEAHSLLHPHLPRARRAFGAEGEAFLQIRWNYAWCLSQDDESSRDDVLEAVGILEELSQTTLRILGPAHPLTRRIQDNLEDAQWTLAAAEASTASEEEESEEEAEESEASFESSTTNN